MSFKEITAEQLKDNIFSAISKEYMLITAGDREDYNMMTASWGFMGEMWGHHEVMVVVRPQRYTMEFIDKQDFFTISFYGDNKDIHKICGSKSGRDVNKTKETGLTPVFDENSVYFSEARLVIVLKKEYVSPFVPDGFTDEEPLKWYNGDFHNMVFGKIVKILIKE